MSKTKKKSGKVAEQTEFEHGEWKTFLKTPLGAALDKYVNTKKILEAGKDGLSDAADKVLIEMKKAGKDYICPQIDGVFYEFEIAKAQEKLKFKRKKS